MSSSSAAGANAGTSQSATGSTTNEAVTWHDIVDSIAQTDPSLIGFAPTRWTERPIDQRDIVSLNRARLETPVPVDFLGNPRARDNPQITRLEETLLDAYHVCRSDDAPKLTREQLTFDAAEFVYDTADDAN